MVIAARRNVGPHWRRGCLALATSPDLETWSLEPEPLYEPGNTFCPECPEIFRLGTTWYLVYSRFSENAATIYRTAESLRGPWRTPRHDALEGRRWYAAKSLPVGDDRRMFFGWIADRAGEWSLDALDQGFMDVQTQLWGPLMDYWFRMEVDGWENIPEPPALLIGIHSGAPFVWDAWTVGFHWWRRFGAERPVHGTAHDALMAAPGIGHYFRKMNKQKIRKKHTTHK